MHIWFKYLIIPCKTLLINVHSQLKIEFSITPGDIIQLVTGKWQPTTQEKSWLHGIKTFFFMHFSLKLQNLWFTCILCRKCWNITRICLFFMGVENKFLVPQTVNADFCTIVISWYTIEHPFFFFHCIEDDFLQFIYWYSYRFPRKIGHLRWEMVWNL